MTDNARDNLIPVFYMKAVQNNFESEKQGRAIWEEVPYVEIMIPGDKLSEVHEKVKEHHKERWPDKWAAFKANQEAPTDGTPLDDWPPVSRAIAMQLSSSNVRTVEALADLSDLQLSKVMPMGGNALREKARAWLKTAEEMAPLADMQAALAAETAKREALERQVQELSALLPRKQDEAA
jgi:hypothetical protein